MTFPSNPIIADSTFYICFLDDIDKSQVLVNFTKTFTFFTTTILENEISKSKNFNLIKSNKRLVVFNFPFNISEILRPFFGRTQILKGEHEVIAFAFVLHRMNKDFILILDEDGPRNFVTRHFSSFSSNMTGTVGFLGRCHCEFKILQKKEALDILNDIELSKFRVPNTVLNMIRSRIQGC